MMAEAMVDWWVPRRVASTVAMMAVLKDQKKVARRAVRLVGMSVAHLVAWKVESMAAWRAAS